MGWRAGFLLVLMCGVALAKPTAIRSTPGTTATKNAVAYTGLIVDTTGFPVSRSTSPHIYDETGHLVFGLIPDKTGAVKGQNVELAMKIGVAGYAYKLSDAEKNKRVGKHPLIVRIVNIHAAPENWYPKDVMVSKKDGDCILAANGNGHFLEKFKVMFVVNPANL